MALPWETFFFQGDRQDFVLNSFLEMQGIKAATILNPDK
jgi:hypothetical protein